MKPLHKRLARLAAALGGAALCWACNAPFIPVPPPAQTTTFSSELVAGEDGGQKTVWIAHGAPIPGASLARVYVFDVNFGAGVIAEAAVDGSYTSPPLDGTMGDRVEISYELPGKPRTSDLCFLLTTDSPDTGKGPSAPACPEPSSR
jgi:hypothetical protein